MTFLPQPKPRPALLAKRDRAADRDAIDRRESAKTKARSGGQCEVRLDPPFAFLPVLRCRQRASQVHHLIGGQGRRNRGRSILADYKLHVCAECHRDITGHVLQPCVSRVDAECAARVRYERVR